MDDDSHILWRRPSHLPSVLGIRTEEPRSSSLSVNRQILERSFEEEAASFFNSKPKLPLLQDQEDREILDFFQAVFRRHKRRGQRSSYSNPSSDDPSLPIDLEIEKKRQEQSDAMVLGLGVSKGSVFVKGLPFSQQERAFTFIPTHELGPPGALNRWLVDVKGFREDEISFSLKDDILEVDCRSNRPPSKEELVGDDHTPWDNNGIKGKKKIGKVAQKTQRTEAIQLPPNSNLGKLRVYENKQLAKLIVALMP